MEAMKGTSLLGKLKSMISVIHSIFLWMIKALPSNVQTLKLAFPFHDHHLRNLGLRSLPSSTARSATSIIYSYIVPPPPPPPPPPSSSPSLSLSSLLWQASSTSLTWSYSTTGDLLGTESGVHMSSNEEILQEELKYKRTELLYLKSSTTPALKKRDQMGDGAKKVYPPTISCLARALTREYVDGRLILREDRGKSLGYMEAERENGRLRLNLLPLYDSCSDLTDEEEDEEEPKFIDQEEDGKFIDEDLEAENEEDIHKSGDGDGNENEIEEVISIKSKKRVDNCMRRCITYSGNGIPTSSSLFGLPIPVTNG